MLTPTAIFASEFTPFHITHIIETGQSQTAMGAEVTASRYRVYTPYYTANPAPTQESMMNVWNITAWNAYVAEYSFRVRRNYEFRRT